MALMKVLTNILKIIIIKNIKLAKNKIIEKKAAIDAIFTVRQIL